MDVTAKVSLLRYTSGPERVVALAAKLCHSYPGVDELSERVGAAETEQFLQTCSLTAVRHASRDIVTKAR